MLALTLAFAALIGAAPANAAKGKGKVTRLQVNCAGDVLSGKAKVSGAANVSLRLLTKRSAKAAPHPSPPAPMSNTPGSIID